MFSKIQCFVLVGLYQGKIMNVNGYEFVDGEYEFVGNDGQIVSFICVFGFYGVLLVEQVELQELCFKQGGKLICKQLDEVIVVLLGENIDVDYVVGVMCFYFGDLFIQGDELMVCEVVVVLLGDVDQVIVGQNINMQELFVLLVLLSLVEVIGLLDLVVDQDWMFNNLLNFECFEVLIGKKLFCVDVDVIVDGYICVKVKVVKV